MNIYLVFLCYLIVTLYVPAWPAFFVMILASTIGSYIEKAIKNRPYKEKFKTERETEIERVREKAWEERVTKRWEEK